MRTRRTQSVLLTRSCPFCGGTSHAEAKLPVPANLARVVFDLDDLPALVERESISLLLALVDLLPYKNFTCGRCRADFRLESQSAKDLLQAMLASMQPVLPPRPLHALATVQPRPRTVPRPRPAQRPEEVAVARHDADWEVESLDALLGPGNRDDGSS